MDKTISLHLNKGRSVSGTLRGYDQFMNIVLSDAVEEVSSGEGNNIGMVVRLVYFAYANFGIKIFLIVQVVRGNSIVQVSELSI